MRRIRLHAILAAALSLAFGAAFARAQALEVKLELPILRCIQTRAAGEKMTDDVYLLVTGFANGKAISTQFPGGDAKTWKMNPKTPVDKPIAVWEGKLEDGEFAYISVALLHGAKQDQSKAFIEQRAASNAKVAGLSEKTLKAAGLDPLREAAQKAAAGFHGTVKELFPAGKGDLFGGSFDVILLNAGGKLEQRLTPVGLTSGEHFGIKAKTYSKIKFTRQNVLVKDANGQWYEIQVPPINEEETIVRVKMLETIMVPGKVRDADTGKDVDGLVPKVTDYLVEVQAKVAGKPVKWTLDGEKAADKSIVHTYFEFAK